MIFLNFQPQDLVPYYPNSVKSYSNDCKSCKIITIEGEDKISLVGCPDYY